MSEGKTIGIIGGMGPYAGIDLAKKVLDQTIAMIDQEHLPIVLISFPSLIGDRTEYLKNHKGLNPAYAIFKILKYMGNLGVDIVGIPCNTFHSDEIFSIIYDLLKKEGVKIKLINLIDEVSDFIKINFPDVRYVGVLSTTGAFISKVYEKAFVKRGLIAVTPEKVIQENVVNRAIYDRIFGIKSCASQTTEFARELLINGINHLENKGAQLIVLGCSEMPLALTNQVINNIQIIDTTLVLARALIREAAPQKLKPYQTYISPSLSYSPNIVSDR